MRRLEISIGAAVDQHENTGSRVVSGKVTPQDFGNVVSAIEGDVDFGFVIKSFTNSIQAYVRTFPDLIDDRRAMPNDG